MIPEEAILSGKAIKEEARRLGFDLVGIAASRTLEEQKDRLNSWIGKKMNADMSYLSRNMETRLNPALLLPGARSVIVTGLNYYPALVQGSDDIPIISKYAYGEDYHYVIKEKLKNLLNYILSINPRVKAKICVDSTPVLEKAWAMEAGLGWVGKNSLIITKELGSFLFLGVIIIDIELDYDKPFLQDHCGNCDLCLKSCPVSAINDNHTIDAGKCISWLTVENENEIAPELKGKLKNRVFGCDICQDACPWNKNLRPGNVERFSLNPEVQHLSADDWKNLNEPEFERLFRKTPVERIGFKKVSSTIRLLLEQ